MPLQWPVCTPACLTFSVVVSYFGLFAVTPSGPSASIRVLAGALNARPQIKKTMALTNPMPLSLSSSLVLWGSLMPSLQGPLLLSQRPRVGETRFVMMCVCLLSVCLSLSLWAPGPFAAVPVTVPALCTNSESIYVNCHHFKWCMADRLNSTWHELRFPSWPHSRKERFVMQKRIDLWTQDCPKAEMDVSS